jgi:hypothetical protein
MLSVKILSGDTMIGTADLFASDPPMGVASGKLVVNDAYDTIRRMIDSLNRDPHPDWSILDLKAFTHEGDRIEAVGGILIGDLLDVYVDEVPDIDILGIADSYERWFGTDPAYRNYYVL